MNFLQIKFENDSIFKNNAYPDMRSEVFSSGSAEFIRARESVIIENYLVKTDTISAILSESGADKKIIALNFANAMFPGGGYILGGNAQEEALCRASLLYYTLQTAKPYYWANRLHILPDYTNHMIYSENVPIIRDNAGNLLNSPVVCDFITCPAVNRNFAKFMFSRKKLDTVMKMRISNIIQLAIQHKPDVLVLGAFGCGMFGNSRKLVYPLFAKAIQDFVPEYVKIIFADPSANNY